MASSDLSDNGGVSLDQRGLTIIEMVLVVSVLVLLLVAAAPSLTNAFFRFQLQAQTEDLLQVVRLAQAKAMGAEADDVWGVHFDLGSGGGFTLYKGSNFASRDADYDEAYVLPTAFSLGTTITGQDIVFTKLEGLTDDVGTLTIEWSEGALSNTLEINSAGRLDLQ